MSDTKVDDPLADTISSLKFSMMFYDMMKGDSKLPPAFHGAGKSLGLVRQTLEGSVDQLNGDGTSGSRTGYSNSVVFNLKEVNEKARLLESIFREVASAPETSRLLRYHAAVGEQGKDCAAEALMIGILKSSAALIDDGTIKATEEQAKGLRDAMHELAAMEPSVPDDGPRSKFSHSGSGDQFNNMDSGTQNINTGSGKMFNAQTMQFGKE